MIAASVALPVSPVMDNDVATKHITRPARPVWPRATAKRIALSIGGLGAFAVGVFIRPDAAIGLVVLGALFIVLERLFPIRRQRVFRRGFATECVHFVVDEVLCALTLAAVLVVALPMAHFLVPRFVRSTLWSQPHWLVAIEGMFIAEVGGYWGHRSLHEIGFLWRIHALHHSAEAMDWLAPNRRHPLDMVIGRGFVILPMFALGFGLPIVAGHFAIRRFQGLLVHANIRLNARIFTWIIATPEFHHWHHADQPEAYNKNYAGQLPLVDWLFGTLHLPHPTWPERYGCGVTPPASYLQQLVWPFRRTTSK